MTWDLPANGQLDAYTPRHCSGCKDHCHNKCCLQSTDLRKTSGVLCIDHFAAAEREWLLSTDFGRTLRVLKQQEVLGGYDPARYRAERVHAPLDEARDAAARPVLFEINCRGDADGQAAMPLPPPPAALRGVLSR